MKIGRREQILILIVGTVAIIVLGQLFWRLVATPFTTRHKALAALASNVQTRERQLKELTKAKEKLAEWSARSLPADPVLARRLYQNWLLECAQQAQLENIQVDSGEVRREKDLFYRLPFTVRGQGSLESLTKFLYSFYSRNYLHTIQRIAITPFKDGKRVDLLFSIEAAALDTAVAKDSLPSGDLVQTKLDDYKEYVKVIAGRNVFVAYSLPPPEPPRRPQPPRTVPRPPPEPPLLDPIQFAYVNGIVEVNGERQVWLYSRTEDKTLKLSENETFRVGKTQGRVIRIGLREVELEVNGETRKVSLGESILGKSSAARG
ncbi:MAG: hypothetical protein ACUVQG_01325 [Thermogutta sp.]